MPTPCRVTADSDSIIPDLQDVTIEKPKPGVIRISAAAIEGRLRRIFTPNVRGDYKVSQEILEQWRSKKGRRSLEQVFQSVGFSTDWFW